MFLIFLILLYQPLTSAFRKLVSEVPLRCLSSLRKEMNIMTVNIMNLTGSLSADNLYNLNCVVVRILIQVRIQLIG